MSGRAARKPTRYAAGRTYWNVTDPTWRHSPSSIPNRAEGCDGWRPAAPCASRYEEAGRVGAAIAAVLSGSGVGRVEVLDGGCAEPCDVSPGGLPASAVGERRDSAARQLVRRSFPGPAPRSVQPVAGHAGGEPGLSLIVVAPRDGLTGYVPDPRTAEPWIASGTPHLYAGVIEATGFVGPLVLPGGTACAGCLDLNRRDRDQQWPRMLAQWQSGRRTAVQACDLGLATAVAGLAASHALAFLDGEL